MHFRSFTFILALCFAGALSGCETPSGERKTEITSCATNMSTILLYARAWSYDNGDWLPTNFLSMSNVLASPFILHCPADHGRDTASNWAAFTPDQSSYEILCPGGPVEWTNGAYLRCKIHGDLLGYSDGVVYEGTRLDGGKLVASPVRLHDYQPRNSLRLLPNEQHRMWMLRNP
jgi:hypothetical protein